MTINGLDVVVMFDTGSTLDAVSPEFTQVVNMKIHLLDEPMGIQLGCKGSKSKIVFSTSGPVWYSSIVGTHYFDVVNIDQFDAIIGMGFMRKFGITLEPEHDSILISRIPTPTLSEGEETAELACRHLLRCAQPVSHWHEEAGLSGSAEKRWSVHVEEIEDEDVPCRNIWVLTTSHSCLKLTKVEPPKLTWWAMTIEVVDDEDTLKERKGLSWTLPVLMDQADSLTIDDIEDIVDRVSTAPVILEEDAATTLEDLHKIDEIMQEFMCVGYPRRLYDEGTALQSNSAPSEPIPAKKLTKC